MHSSISPPISTRRDIPCRQPTEWHGDSAARVALDSARWMLARRAPPSVLNVNVPTRPIDETVGLRWADLDRFGHIRVAAVNRTGRGLAFDVRGAESGLDERCHTALCLRGTVTLTMLSSLEALAAPGADPNDVVRLGRAS